jgi:CheY-like chemotaxis protein/PAS domain-containing protein
LSDQPRILVLGDAGPAGQQWLRQCRPEGELVHADSWAGGLDLLRQQHFDAVLANPRDAGLLGTIRGLIQSQRILATVPDGVAVVDFDLKIRWANRTFEAWCGGPAAGRGFYEALGSPDVVGPDYCPFHTALANFQTPAGQALVTSTRLHCRGNRHVDLHITPIPDLEGGKEPLLIALGRDVTAMVLQQQKLDALHKAGAELAALAPEQLADMSAAERIELLKLNIRKFTRDLLHYEVVEIRLLDRATGRLELLLQEGMIPEAAGRVLSAGTEGQGVTGYVAATGKSYFCPDTTADPLYLPGAPGAHSSLTVPLLYQDQVIGTFNIESPRVNAFGEDDLQFTELFGREIASALHTLELLSAQKSSTATQSVEAVSREVALPVDEILAAAASVLERYIGHDPEIADKLKRILAGARQIKQCIQKVGEDIAPPPATSARPAAPASFKGMRVLVADNDDRVRRSAHGLLGRWGCVVETARDGQEALTMARLGTYDAILADIRLPDVPGYEMYRRLREAQPQARVILMTGYGYDPSHTLVKARQDGLRCVLFKPFRVDQLLSALATPVVQNSDGGLPAGAEAKLPAASSEAR